MLGVALVLFFARERRSVWLFVFLVQPSFAFFEQYQSLPAISEVHRPSRTNDHLANYAIMPTTLRGRPPEKNRKYLSVFRKSGNGVACGHHLRVRHHCPIFERGIPGADLFPIEWQGPAATASVHLARHQTPPVDIIRPHPACINHPFASTGNCCCRRHHVASTRRRSRRRHHFATAPSPSSSTPSRPTLFIVDGAYPLSYTPRRVQWTRRCNNNHRRAGGEY
jgi:hypothetical protein